MIVLIVIGWALALPLLVVLGLYAAARILGRRTRARGTIDITAFARMLPGLPSCETTLAAADDRAHPAQAPPVGAGYWPRRLRT